MIKNRINDSIGKYKKFKSTLPDNLRLGKSSSYAMKRSWRDSGKPKNFDEAKENMFFPVYHPEEDKTIYHGSSVSNKSGKFYKPKSHKSTYMELEGYRDNPDMKEFRENTKLVSRGKYWKYKAKTNRDVKNSTKVDARTNKRIEKGISMSKNTKKK
jgi:hypothetical protein